MQKPFWSHFEETVSVDVASERNILTDSEEFSIELGNMKTKTKTSAREEPDSREDHLGYAAIPLDYSHKTKTLTCTREEPDSREDHRGYAAIPLKHTINNMSFISYI